MHPPLVFAPILAAALGLFAASCWGRFSLVTRGAPENRFDRPLARTGRMLRFAFGQARVMRQPYGTIHLLIFWPFILLLLENAEFVLNGLFPSVSFLLLPAALDRVLFYAFDVVSIAALAAVLFGIARRLFFAPARLESRDVKARSFDAFLILSMIAVLMLTSFGQHGAEIALGTASASDMPISAVAGGLLAGLPTRSIEILAGTFWWIHAAVLLFFLNYLPFGKHMHILTAIPNVWFQSLGRPNTQRRETFQEGTRFGADRVTDLSWKDLFDSLSCTECGRCQEVCPAASTGKPLNPRQVVHDIKINMLANGKTLRRGGQSVLPLIGDGGEGSVSEEALWACTTCGACMEACPVFIEHLPKIVSMRRTLVETRSSFPEELHNLFEGMEQRSNPWGIAPAERTKWSSQLPVRPFEAGKTEYLFYVGCAGAMDAHGKLVSAAIARLLDAAGVTWGILGKEEKCCGDSLRRLGNEFVFDKMARENVALLKEKGVTKVVTYCPHCLSTLKNDYRQFGLELEVVHHSELFSRLMAEGRLKLADGSAGSAAAAGNAVAAANAGSAVAGAAAGNAGAAGRTVYHDSCYLGRHNGIYDAPRDLVARATGAPPLEIARNRDKSFCCGAGGGRMWMEESSGTRINRARVKEALAESPETICVACPYCMTMFEDGLKDEGARDVQVRDVAEVLADRLKAPSAT